MAVRVASVPARVAPHTPLTRRSAWLVLLSHANTLFCPNPRPDPLWEGALLWALSYAQARLRTSVVCTALLCELIHSLFVAR